MEFPCNYCLQTGRDLRRCSGCYKVYYCSRECQTSDWKSNHKRICKTTKNDGETKEGHQTASEPSGGTQNGTQSTGNNMADNKEKQSSEKTKSEEKQSDRKSKCAFCGTNGETKKCKNCMKVRYCSRDCQKNDWKRHKSQCGKTKDSGPKQGGKTKDSGPKHDSSSTPSAEEHLKKIAQRDALGLKLRYVTKPSMYKIAMEQAKKAYPSHRLVNKFKQVPSESSGFQSENSGIVLVAFISRFHPNFIRNCLYLQDICKEEMVVAFYFDSPKPYFDWDFATPARYMFIEDPVVHKFLDGSTGVRVDEARKVKVVASDYLCYENASWW